MKKLAARYFKELLRLVHVRGDLGTLVSLGFTYSQLAETLIQAERESFLEKTCDGYILSKKGLLVIIDEVHKKNWASSQNPWICLKKSHRIESISVDEVFLPKLSDSKFD